MAEFTQTYIIKAPVHKVWQALTDAAVAEQWGAGPAKVEASEGGIFSYWDEDIHGTYTKLVENELLEQDWYGHDHPEEKYRAVFTFEPADDATVVTLNFSGHLYDEARDRTDWDEYYFGPIREFLEK